MTENEYYAELEKKEEKAEQDLSQFQGLHAGPWSGYRKTKDQKQGRRES